MVDVSIPVVGPTYTNRSLPVGAQHTQNFYIEINPASNEPVSLMPFPGLKSFATAGAGKGRGMALYNDEAYTVSGTELYKVASNGVTTLIGTIAGTNRVSMVDDGSNLVIANGANKPYSYDGTDLNSGSDADLPNANTVAHINSRVIYDQPTGIAFADLDTPLTVNSANILLSNTRKSDDCKAVITHRQQVFAFNEETIEPSYFTGSGNPPYSRVNNAVQEIGTESPHSIDFNKNFVYFLGKDRRVYRMSGLDSRAIDNPAIGQAIHDYTVVDDAFGICFTFDAQNFYLLSFPSESKTWLFNESAPPDTAWTSLAYGTDSAAHLISGYVYAYGKHLVSDRRNGNIYELDFDTYTDNGDVIQRRRSTANLNGRYFGKPGAKVFMSRLQLIIEPGVSLVSDEAQIIMQYSDDNGRTWSSERWSSIGQQGDYTYKVEWYSLGMFYNRMFRFTMSDAVKWVIVSCNADVELGL